MKRSLVFFFTGGFLMISSVACAVEKEPLGIGTIAIKLDYINFTDSVIETFDYDSGLYIGVEDYFKVVPNFYLGAEVGYANPDGSTLGGTELTFIPVEVNSKFARELTPKLIVDLGAGISYIYVEEEFITSSFDDWLFGGQFFADLNYKTGNFFFGVNAKYQFTQDFKDVNYNYTNLRIGGQAGFMF